MRRLLFYVIAFLISAIPIIAEAQSGKQSIVIRSHGRLYPGGKQTKGEPIANALVTIKDLSGTLLSDDAGSLTFGIPSGERYALSSVYKEGHTLTDFDVLSEQHYYSKEPLRIYMEDISAMEEYRYVISTQVRNEYQKKLHAQQDELDRLRAEGNVAQEELRRLQGEISRAWQDSESVIADITERYLNIDFDNESREDVEFHTHILNGDIELAKSLVNTPEEIERKAREARVAQAAVDNLKVDVSRHCLRMCEIYQYEFKPDSVAYYMELRASVDRTNIDWQREAGMFIQNILGDYIRALAILNPALDYCLEHYGEIHDITASMYNDIGVIYSNKGQYDEAMEYYIKSLAIREKVLDPMHPDLATTYNNIGWMYSYKGQYDEAMEYYIKSLAIREKVLDPLHPDLAATYGSIGLMYIYKGQYDEAMEYCCKALAIREKVLAPQHHSLADVYGNIGWIYANQGQYDEALKYLGKALSIYENIYPKDHPVLQNVKSFINQITSKQGK